MLYKIFILKGLEDCGQIVTEKYFTGHLETAECYKRQAYICEIDAGAKVNPVEPKTGFFI